MRQQDDIVHAAVHQNIDALQHVDQKYELDAACMAKREYAARSRAGGIATRLSSALGSRSVFFVEATNIDMNI